jgi:nickel-dependent lactate racemase
MIYFSGGAVDASFSRDEIRQAITTALDLLGGKKRVLMIPPDFTRFHSQSGVIAEMIWEHYGDRLKDVLPATGTHYPMTDDEISAMFGSIPKSLFRIHDWQKGLTTLGEAPAELIQDLSEGKLNYSIPFQVDDLAAKGSHDLIVSIGQIVPHEVIGMAGYNKNIFVGIGGGEGFNRTHFLGAVYGMERMMGRSDTPVRKVLNYGSDHFASHLPVVYILTVIGKGVDGNLAIRGLFIGDDVACFYKAAELSQKVNFQMLDEPLEKVVVYLDPAEYRSTWLGNKSIYRTRMAIADGGELIILAPGLSTFGEDPAIDGLIRKYGYSGTPGILERAQTQEDLARNLGTAAHLIHGSSEERFAITYCPGIVSRKEIEQVNFRYANLGTMMETYNPKLLQDGFNVLGNGEKIFFISNPALGLWADKKRFESASQPMTIANAEN